MLQKRILDDETFAEVVDSLERGRGARKRCILSSALVLAVVIATLVAFQKTDGLGVALTVAVGALCIIWAIMSMSASLNAQFDQLTGMLAHYAESERLGRARKPQRVCL